MIPIAEEDTVNNTRHFDERCYALLQRIPAGKVTTYGEMARALEGRAWRAVGSAMARNRRLVEIPCHRVVRSDGRVGEYASGAGRKVQLLQGEGVAVHKGRVQNLEQYLFRFSDADT